MSLLPPEAWLRERPWGRALRHLVSGEVDRLDRRIRIAMEREEDAVAIIAMLGCRDAGEPESVQLRNIDAAHLLADWLRQGSEVFRFGSALTQELEHTDVEDVLCEEVVLPYRSLYMTFEGLAPFESGLRGIMLDERHDADGRHLLVVPMSDTIHLLSEETSTRLGIEVNLAPGVPLLEQLDEAIRLDLLISGNHAEIMRHVGDSASSDLLIANAHFATKAYESLRPLLPLLVNGLLYIDQCRTDIRTSWPREAPAGDAAKADSATPGARKAEQRLRAAGWTRIRICEIERDGNPIHEETGGSRTIEAHWRRGHWRRQRHGVENMLVKRIRVRPVRVKGRSGEAERHDAPRTYGVMKPKREK